MEILGIKIDWLGHAAFKIEKYKKIFIDPYQLKIKESADIILITHDHFDHCSIEDINKIASKETIIIAAEKCKKELEKLKDKVSKIMYVKPNEKLNFEKIAIETFPSYNINKNFHPKNSNYVGYIIDIEGIRIYHAGDTDLIDEMKELKVDIALLPVGGTYTMNYKEAAEAVKLFRPKFAIPMHYGSIVGSEEDAEKFKELASNFSNVIILK